MIGRLLFFLLLFFLSPLVHAAASDWQTNCVDNRACLHLDVCYGGEAKSPALVMFEIISEFVDKHRPVPDCGKDRRSGAIRLELKLVSPGSGLYLITTMEDSGPLELQFGSGRTLKIDKKSKSVQMSGSGQQLKLDLVSRDNISEAFWPIKEGRVFETFSSESSLQLNQGKQRKHADAAAVKKWLAKAKTLGSKICDFSTVNDGCKGDGCDKIPESSSELKCSKTLWAHFSGKWVPLNRAAYCDDFKWRIYEDAGDSKPLDNIKLICSTQKPVAVEPLKPDDASFFTPVTIGLLVGGTVLVVLALVSFFCYLLFCKTDDEEEGRRRRKRKRKHGRKGKARKWGRFGRGIGETTTPEPMGGPTMGVSTAGGFSAENDNQVKTTDEGSRTGGTTGGGPTAQSPLPAKSPLPN